MTTVQASIWRPVLAAVVSLTLAGCGAAATSGSTQAKPAAAAAKPVPRLAQPPAKSAGTTGHAAAGTAKAGVFSMLVDKTSQMVPAGQPATFTVTALTRAGGPAAGKPVTFYIGPMVPLSGVPPQHWYASGTAAAKRYIASYSKMTDAKGQATLRLSKQPAKAMEMVDVRIGTLSSFSAKRNKALGSLDAWWTAPGVIPTAPVGDWVTVRPFVTRAAVHRSVKLDVSVRSPAGPIAGAAVQFIDQAASMGAKPASSGMAKSTGMAKSGTAMSGTAKSAGTGMMSSSGGTTIVTDASGVATYMLKTGGAMSVAPVRVVVTQGKAKSRVAGGMNSEFVVR